MQLKPEPQYIIADHFRASAFIIADGVMPSGKQRGYILRRLIRRAFSACLKMDINIANEMFFVEIVDKIIDIYKNPRGDSFYPELETNRALIIQVLTAEAQKYLRAIETGKKQWAKILKD